MKPIHVSFTHFPSYPNITINVRSRMIWNTSFLLTSPNMVQEELHWILVSWRTIGRRNFWLLSIECNLLFLVVYFLWWTSWFSWIFSYYLGNISKKHLQLAKAHWKLTLVIHKGILLTNLNINSLIL